MRYQNRLMSNDDDSIDNNVVIDTSETSSNLAPAFFTLQNPALIPSLFGSFGVVCVCLILCRVRLYRIFIQIAFGNGFYQRKSSASRLKSESTQRQYVSMSSLSKP